MSDDIVTRLRAKYLGQLPIVQEAADEIERLRGQLLELSRLADVGAVIPTSPYPKHKIKWWQR